MASQSRFGPLQRGSSLTQERLSPETSLRQCAWCLLVQDAAGQYNIQPNRKIRSATHGICPDCKEAMRAEIEGRSVVLARAA